MRVIVRGAALLAICCCPLALGKADTFETQPYSVESLTRQIDLSSSQTYSSSVYVLQRQTTATPADDALPPFKVAIDDFTYGNLSWIEASLGKGTRGESLPVVRAYHDLQKTATIYNVLFPQTLSYDASNNITVTVTQVYNHLASPLPKTLEHSSVDGQYLLWQADLLAGAALLGPVKEARVRVKMPSPQVKRFHAPPAFSTSHTKGSQTIVFTSKEAFLKPAIEIGAVHYFSPEPVVAFKNLKRSVQVSHWRSSVAIEDEIELINNGPKLKGHFSRLTHQQQSFTRRGSSVAPHVMTGLTFQLPPRVTSPYFYDTVGNVSTSHFRSSSDPPSSKTKSARASVLDVLPRYPLMGGWTYNFTIGYVAPLQDYLTTLSEREYELRVPFISAVKDVPADTVEVRISLPESADIVKIVPPFPVDSMTQEILYTYFDTTGKPTIVLKKSSCSHMHAKDIVITYRYSLLAYFQTTIAYSAVFLVFATSVQLFRKLDWRLHRGSKAKKIA